MTVGHESTKLTSSFPMNQLSTMVLPTKRPHVNNYNVATLGNS